MKDLLVGAVRLLLVVGVLLAASSAGAVEPVFPGRHWLTMTPEEAGLDPEKLDEFARKVGGDGLVVRHGRVVKAWGNPAARADWASACKPVISTLLFFAVQEQKLPSVDAPVRPWVKKRWPGKDLLPKDRTMTFRHLADMTSGYTRAEQPGTHWAYNDYTICLYCGRSSSRTAASSARAGDSGSTPVPAISRASVFSG